LGDGTVVVVVVGGTVVVVVGGTVVVVESGTVGVGTRAGEVAPGTVVVVVVVLVDVVLVVGALGVVVLVVVVVPAPGPADDVAPGTGGSGAEVSVMAVQAPAVCMVETSATSLASDRVWVLESEARVENATATALDVCLTCSRAALNASLAA